jgi:hypothetical protein
LVVFIVFHYFYFTPRNGTPRSARRGGGVPSRSRHECQSRELRAVEKFREKYGPKDVKKYYAKFDVAVVVELGSNDRT